MLMQIPYLPQGDAESRMDGICLREHAFATKSSFAKDGGSAPSHETGAFATRQNRRNSLEGCGAERVHSVIVCVRQMFRVQDELKAGVRSS